MNKKLIAITIAGLFPTAMAHAFGVGDLVSIGVQAGSEIVRAAGSKAVDTIKDSMRDPEAEAREKEEQERKLAEQMQKQIDEIEAMPNLRPIDRERLVLKLKQTWQASKETQAFVEYAEAQQKAERDRVLTVGGIAGVVGRAAMSSPSMVVAQADLMANNPVWRAEQRMHNEAAFRQADAMVAAGIPQAKAQGVLAQADALKDTGLTQAGTKAIVDNAEELAKVKQTSQDAAILLASANETSIPSAPQASGAGSAVPDAGASTKAAVTAVASVDVQSQAQATPPDAAQNRMSDAFSPDLGKKIWIEFEGAPNETEALRKLLQERGHVVVQDREEAEVVYLIQGEFVVPETKMHEGLTKSVGNLLESPAQAIEPPARKALGAIGSGIGRFMLAAAGATAPAQQENGYHQSVLLVIARQPKDGKETRASVVRDAQGETIEAVELAQGAKEDLYRVLGI